MPTVRRLLDDLAGRAVPDLGPAAVMDQLTVLVYDTCEAGGDPVTLTTQLAQLRRDLA